MSQVSIEVIHLIIQIIRNENSIYSAKGTAEFFGWHLFIGPAFVLSMMLIFSNKLLRAPPPPLVPKEERRMHRKLIKHLWRKMAKIAFFTYKLGTWWRRNKGCVCVVCPDSEPTGSAGSVSTEDKVVSCVHIIFTPPESILFTKTKNFGFLLRDLFSAPKQKYFCINSE